MITVPLETSKMMRTESAIRGCKAEEPLSFKFTAWVYSDPSKHNDHVKKFVKFFNKNLPGSLAWTIRSDKTMLPVALHKAENKAFTPLEISFSSPRNRKWLPFIHAAKLKDDAEKFDSLFAAVSELLKSKKLKEAVCLEKSTMICWALHKSGYPYAAKMSRWVLPVPAKPIFFPAERIEQVLYNLVSIQLKRQDTVHAHCSGGAVLDCIENQLYKQKQAHETLSNVMNDLTRLELDENVIHSAIIKVVIDRNIAALEDVDMSLTTLVALFDKYIGRAPPTKGKWKIIRKIKRFIKGPLAAVAINDKAVEDLKKKARNDLAAFQRISPILAAHIRLHDGGRKDELQRVCNSATAGPEKTEMPGKLAIVPANLYNLPNQAAQLKRVRGHYEDTYCKLLSEVEALNKVVGGEYARRGDKLFNIRGKWGRFGRKKKCQMEGCKQEDGTGPGHTDVSKDEKGVKNLTVKTEAGDDSSDGESYYDEKEPKWMV